VFPSCRRRARTAIWRSTLLEALLGGPLDATGLAPAILVGALGTGLSVGAGRVRLVSEFRRGWDDAVRMGQENQHIVEIARRHCTNMEFVQSEARGSAEAETGLPINRRQVRCPVALGSMSANLRWIAVNFYSAHCTGCSLRRPTGEVPSLKTVVEERSAQDAREAARRDAETERALQQWRFRADRRRAVAVSGGEAMADAVANIGLLDPEPGIEVDPAEQDAARDRLAVLADRAPQVFSSEVVAFAIELVVDVGVAEELIEPLRRLARTRREFAAPVCRAALAVLRRGPATAAGRCVADSSDLLSPRDLDEQVCRSLVLLAEAPRRNRIGRLRPSRAADSTGLRVAGDLAPDVIVAVLRRLLPPPEPSRSLLLPTPETPRRAVPDAERAAAGAAIAALARTHPHVAAQMIPTLILDLGVQAQDRHDDPATPALAGALAVMLVLGIGDVTSAVEDAGRTGSPELREALFDVFARAADLLDPTGARRQPGDPLPVEERRTELRTSMLTLAVARVSGDWGNDLRVRAARLVSRLAQPDTTWTLFRVPVLLGTVLGLVDDLKTPPPSTLEVVSTDPPQARVIEQLDRQTAIKAAIREVLDAVETAARADPETVVTAITTHITNERDWDRGPDLVWRLLRPLGRIGRRHGRQPGVLPAILPVLHSYMVDAEPALRAQAIDQWVEINRAHQLPSSLQDLLPALSTDPYIVVIRAVLHAARRLDWPDGAKPTLLLYALQALDAVDATDHPDVIKEGINAAVRLAADDPTLLAFVESRALEHAAGLDRHHLRDVLGRTWSPEVSRSTRMAELRLRQAADPAVNDRSNPSDDQELCALLDCGAGLVGLPTEDLIGAALREAPEYPLASAELAEVAWRAARPADAATVMRAVAGTIPDQPAFARQQRFTALITAAASADAAGVAGEDWRPDAGRALAAAAELGDEYRSVNDVRAVVSAAADMRGLLSGDPLPGRGHDVEVPGGPGGPAEQDRRRARAVQQVGSRLATPAATATGAYLRGVAGLCEVAYHLLMEDAAVLDADTTTAAAHRTAAQLRAQLMTTALTARFDRSDPLAGPLIGRLEAVADHQPGAGVMPVLAEWVRLCVPARIVRGPRRAVSPRTTTTHVGGDTNRRPIAVALASVDGRLVTGPAVLPPGTVQELTLQVQADPWPPWVDRLDAELLTHLTPADVTTPAFTWHRNEHTGDGETYVQSGPLVTAFRIASRAASAAVPDPTHVARAPGRSTQSTDARCHRPPRAASTPVRRDAGHAHRLPGVRRTTARALRTSRPLRLRPRPATGILSPAHRHLPCRTPDDLGQEVPPRHPRARAEIP